MREHIGTLGNIVEREVWERRGGECQGREERRGKERLGEKRGGKDVKGKRKNIGGLHKRLNDFINDKIYNVFNEFICDFIRV